MKRKMIKNTGVIIIAFLLIISFFLGCKVLLHRYMQSSELIDAILEDDFCRVEEMLQDETVNVNFKGAGLSSFFNRPLERACLQYKSDEKIIELLLKKGAIVKQKDYYTETKYFDLYSYEKLKIMIKHGEKPNIVFENNSLLSNIAYIDVATGKHVYGVSKKEWQDKILKTYKLIYYNAETFDKRTQLKSSLKLAKERKNKPLIEFIEGELEKN